VSLPLLIALSLLHADGPDGPRNAVSFEVPSILWGGVALNGERFTRDHRWSLSIGLEARWAAEGDYRSWTFGTGVEGRWWLKRFRPWFMADRGGPFAGVRLDAAFTRTASLVTSTSLTAWTPDASLRVGYRFVFLHRVELTPYVGGAVTLVITDVPRTVAEPLASVQLGLTVGYLF
jgi:hypothetical protein